MGHIQVSDKFGAAIVVVNGDDAADFTKQLVDLLGEEAATEYIEQLVETMKGSPLEKAKATVAEVAGGTEQKAPSCQHGTKTFLTKPYKNKPGQWKAWACPADRDDPTKCQLEFID